jgi:hypothetical protein
VSNTNAQSASRVPTLGDQLQQLPSGWKWEVVRVIHCMPDDQVDGWRISLLFRDNRVIEVIHRDGELARRIALDAAREIWPVEFKR